MASHYYLELLYSPYLQLQPQTRQALLAGLSARIEHDFGGQLQLAYRSAFHIAQKR